MVAVDEIYICFIEKNLTEIAMDTVTGDVKFSSSSPVDLHALMTANPSNPIIRAVAAGKTYDSHCRCCRMP